MPAPDSNSSKLFVCWTTVAKRADAERLAKLAVETGYAACVQIDGPITSVYRWQDKVEIEEELRLWLKAPEQRLAELEQLIHECHPYDTPQWVCVEAQKVSEKYLKWVGEASNLRGFI